MSGTQVMPTAMPCIQETSATSHQVALASNCIMIQPDAAMMEKPALMPMRGSSLPTYMARKNPRIAPTPRAATSWPTTAFGKPARSCSIGGSITIGVKFSMPYMPTMQSPSA